MYAQECVTYLVHGGTRAPNMYVKPQSCMAAQVHPVQARADCVAEGLPRGGGDDRDPVLPAADGAAGGECRDVAGSLPKRGANARGCSGDRPVRCVHN